VKSGTCDKWKNRGKGELGKGFPNTVLSGHAHEAPVTRFSWESSVC
jgi:hypothetical protein